MNAVNREYQDFLAERAKVRSELEQRRAGIRRLSAGVIANDEPAYDHQAMRELSGDEA